MAVTKYYSKGWCHCYPGIDRIKMPGYGYRKEQAPTIGPVSFIHEIKC